MTLLTLELEDPHDPRLAMAADGLLRTFNEAGVLDAADVHASSGRPVPKAGSTWSSAMTLILNWWPRTLVASISWPTYLA